ncbi:MAG TPA: metallophosphoesterase [bacterium]|nr:metallophosphoesterase [bacterium]
MSQPIFRIQNRSLIRFFQAVAVAAFLLTLAFQGYTFVMKEHAERPLPPLFGNFNDNQDILERIPPKEEFSFAVAGDTRSFGTFERICEELRKTDIDFAVLLGDCTYTGTEEQHQYLRAEWVREYALPCPVFYLVGNHDINPKTFPLNRFEEVYGPSIFSFEYQGSLFIMLRILHEKRGSNEESLAFLRSFRNKPLDQYKYIFAFMHMPPHISPFFHSKGYPDEKELVSLFEELGVDYVFSGDFHGYARVKLRETTFIISGGGGGHLEKQPSGQFTHALMMRVTPDSVEERIVHVPESKGFVDRMERFAIVRFWPKMSRYPSVTVTLNLAVLLALILFLRFTSKCLKAAA